MMKNEAMERPLITEFMGDGFTLDKAHKQYLENLELWNYVQALDAYCDELESKTCDCNTVPDAESGLHLQRVSNNEVAVCDNGYRMGSREWFACDCLGCNKQSVETN